MPDARRGTAGAGDRGTHVRGDSAGGSGSEPSVVEARMDYGGKRPEVGLGYCPAPRPPAPPPPRIRQLATLPAPSWGSGWEDRVGAGKFA